MEKAVSFLRRSLSILFAMVAWIGGSISGEPYIRSGNMEIARTLEFTYADGVSFCQGLAADGTFFYGIGAYKFLDYNAITKIDIASFTICTITVTPAYAQEHDSRTQTGVGVKKFIFFCVQ